MWQKTIPPLSDAVGALGNCACPGAICSFAGLCTSNSNNKIALIHLIGFPLEPVEKSLYHELKNCRDFIILKHMTLR